MLAAFAADAARHVRGVGAVLEVVPAGQLRPASLRNRKKNGEQDSQDDPSNKNEGRHTISRR
jgi:hypothetical protein